MFGISDGLVTNVSLILGVAGAHPGGSVVRLTGLAGLVAGAFSMAAGEYVSMQAQRELLQRELDVERQALRKSPGTEQRELTAIYESRGHRAGAGPGTGPRDDADPDLALETHAREELGINPTRLGSPLQAAVTSFLTFAFGAFLPLLPWLIGSGTAPSWPRWPSARWPPWPSARLGAFTGRSLLRSALRQLALAAVAAGVTYGIGRLVGASGGLIRLGRRARRGCRPGRRGRARTRASGRAPPRPCWCRRRRACPRSGPAAASQSSPATVRARPRPRWWKSGSTEMT